MKKTFDNIALTLLIAAFAAICSAQNITINRDSMNSRTEINYRGIKIGEKIDKVKFENVFNAPNSSFALKDLKDKIVILEFWATWCAPCFPAIEHLKELKQKFPNEIEVISVLQESEERLQRYMKNKPSSLWHIADPDGKLNEFFPHRAIPHTVVIDKGGKVAAITSPKEITESVISQLINNQSIKLPKKEDDLGNGFDMTKDYFPKPENTEYSFDVQPAIPGGFPMTRSSNKNSVWANRRITLINQPIINIYRAIFRFNSIRTIYEGIEKEKFQSIQNKISYCIDVVVPKGKEAELYSYAQKELMALDFEIKARIEKRKVEVGVLTVFDKEKLLAHQAGKNTQVQTGFSVTNASKYNGKGVSIDEMLKSFLESFGHGRMPLINETGVEGVFDFDIQLDLEDKATLKNALAKYGLKMVKEERETEMLVIYK